MAVGYGILTDEGKDGRFILSELAKGRSITNQLRSVRYSKRNEK